jgi:hypothetical protein
VKAYTHRLRCLDNELIPAAVHEVKDGTTRWWRCVKSFATWPYRLSRQLVWKAPMARQCLGWIVWTSLWNHKQSCHSPS